MTYNETTPTATRHLKLKHAQRTVAVGAGQTAACERHNYAYTLNVAVSQMALDAGERILNCLMHCYIMCVV